MADRREVIAIISADASKLDPGLAKGKRKIKSWSKEIVVEMKRGLGSIGSIVGLGGMAGILAAGKQVLDFQTRLVRLRISADASAATMKKLEAQVFAMAKSKGLDPDQILGGAEKFTARTGDLQGYIDGMDSLTNVAAATGASMEDVSMIAATLDQTMGIKSKDWGISFDLIAAGAKKGAVEMKDMAGELVALSPSFARFGAKGVDALTELQALFQMGQRGFTSAGETRTGFLGAMKVIERDAKKLKKLKINVWEGKGKNARLRDFKSIVDELSKLDEKTLGKVFGGDMEAKRFMLAVKGAAGEYDTLADKAKAAGTIAKDKKIWDESPAKKMASAQAKLAEFFNESMKGHIEKVARALDLVADALKVIVDNWQLLVAALFGKKGIDVVLVALERLGKGAAGAAGGGAGGGGGGKGGGANGTAGERLQASLFAFGTGYAAGDWLGQKIGLHDANGNSLLNPSEKLAEATGQGNAAVKLFDPEDVRMDQARIRAMAETRQGPGSAAFGLRYKELLDDASFMGGIGLAQAKDTKKFGALSFGNPYAEAEARNAARAAARKSADDALYAADPTGLQRSQLDPTDMAELQARAANVYLQPGAGGANSQAEVVRLLRQLVSEVQKRPGAALSDEENRRRRPR